MDPVQVIRKLHVCIGLFASICHAVADPRTPADRTSHDAYDVMLSHTKGCHA